MSTPLWAPSPDRIARAHLTRFINDVAARIGQPLHSYRDLHAWSVNNLARFWEEYVRSSGLRFHTPHTSVMTADPMPFTRWFDGATLNYAELLLHGPEPVPPDDAAIIAVDEAGRERRLSWRELEVEVGRAAAALGHLGIARGERVAAFISNVPEAVILLLACARVGAIFTSCSPDFGVDAAYSRFHQIAPKLLVASDGYTYNGRFYATRDVVRELAARLPKPLQVVVVSDADRREPTDWLMWEQWTDAAASDVRAYERLPFDHPLYILYSSGTTGLPKPIVHRAGGALLTHHKEHRLHCDIGAGDRLLYYTTCGWMMWNWLVSALAQRATIVLVDGSASHPSLDTLWRLVDRLQITHFGTSARFIHACKGAGLSPGRLVPLDALRAVLSTGSPLSAGGFEWVYTSVKADVHLASISGGTDIVGCFMLGVPTLPVYSGQIQAAGLAVDLAAFDESGRPVVGRPGELVCRQPLPSMPLGFWNDPDGSRYRRAYFETYPGVWHHGDLIEVTPEGGIVVYGRSDATLNPGGVRIGTAEIYRPLDAIPEIADALAVGKREGDDEVIWLFVVLNAGTTLDHTLIERIKHTIRASESPRHVPRRILQVSQLPRTRSGKTMEIGVARVVNGLPVPNKEAAANPEAFEEITEVVARVGDARPPGSG